MSKFGLTEERYNQMMKYYNNDELRVAEIVEECGAELCNKGYCIFDTGSNLLEILKIDAVGAFEDDGMAAEQAMKDGVKIIPVEELPENFNRKYLGWVDTPENRKAIQEYCDRKIEKKENWIIGINGSDSDGVDIQKVYGTKEQVKKELLRRVYELRDCDQDGYDLGTEDIEQIEEREDGHLVAYICFSDFHFDLEAVKETDIERKILN